MKFFVSLLLMLLIVAGVFVLKPQTLSTKKSVAPTVSLHDKVLSLFIIHIPGTDPAKLSNDLTRYHPAGIILMPDNIPENLDDLKTMTASAQKTSTTPLLISIDQEGCSVKRIQTDTFPCAQDLKKDMSFQTQTAFRDRSLMLKQYGVNLNFGIVADITKDTESFIYPRVFGSDPKTVGEHVAAAVHGSQTITFSTIKHFPGHGETSENSHNTIPVVSIKRAQWESYDAVPFLHGIEAGAEFVMMGHLIYSAIDSRPASLSSTWHSILRNELEFKNIIITDDMIMLQKSGEPQYQDPGKNAVEAIKAGNDIVLFVNEYNLQEEPVRHIDIEKVVKTVEDAVRSGALTEAEIDQHLTKVNNLRNTLH